MWLKKIHLFNFRNFSEKSFNFNPFITIILGENSKGKTNLLEAIYFLLNGKGFREQKEIELIKFEKEKAIVEGYFEEKDHVFFHQILIEKNIKGVEKKYFIDKIRKNQYQFLKTSTKAVIFFPEQLKIINEGPEERRNYFDRLLSEEDSEYRKRLNNYFNGLKKRNKLLEDFSEDKKLSFLEDLYFWNKYLINESYYLIEKRKEYCSFLNQHSFLDNKEFFIEYQPNIIDEEKLNFIFKEEIKQKKTLIGPQRDNFLIFIKDQKQKNIHLFGSRSEQRLGLFWLKINEIRYFEKKFKIRPILLLDDLFSELDIKNRKLILNLIKNYQTILTTTEKETIDLIEGLRSIILI